MSASRRLQNLLPNIISFILLLVLVWLVSSFTMVFFAKPDKSSENETDVAVSKKVQQKTAFEPAPLFGKPAPEKIEAPKKTINIKLEGTLLGERSAAIIASSKEVKAYTVGEKITEQVKLLEVHPNHIIVSNDGVKKKLGMKQGVLETLCTDCLESMANKPTDSTSDNPDKTATPKSTNSDKKKVIANPLKLPDLFSSKTVKKDGKIIGYQIKPKDNLVLFEYLELNSGDIITSVNGVSLGSISSIKELTTKLQRGTSIKINLIRDGRNKSISVVLP